MTIDKNSHGLWRYIPEAVKQEVRRRCGFGCVICGDAIYTYEHMEPRFADATSHQPAAITLLCGGHQTQSSKGLLSLDTIKAANMIPMCRQKGNATHLLDMGKERPVILIGGNRFAQFGSRIAINGKPLFELRPPKKHSKFWRISACFRDETGNVLCEIRDNEIMIGAENTDFEQSAQKFIVSTPDKRGFLELQSHSPNELALNRFAIKFPDGSFVVHRAQVPTPFGEPSLKMVMSIECRGSKMNFINSTFDFPAGINLIWNEGAITLASC